MCMCARMAPCSGPDPAHGAALGGGRRREEVASQGASIRSMIVRQVVVTHGRVSLWTQIGPPNCTHMYTAYCTYAMLHALHLFRPDGEPWLNWHRRPSLCARGQLASPGTRSIVGRRWRSAANGRHLPICRAAAPDLGQEGHPPKVGGRFAHSGASIVGKKGLERLPLPIWNQVA